LLQNPHDITHLILGNEEDKPQSHFVRLWLVASVWVMPHMRVKVTTTAYKVLESEPTVR